MPKFSGKPRPVRKITPFTTPTPHATVRTFEGAPGWVRDARSELFLLGVSNMVGEATFYEATGARDQRFVDLVHKVAGEDPAWLMAFLTWLRDEANMRSAPVVGVAEAVAAGLPTPRSTVNKVLVRADEPAELVGYWLAFHGRRMPQALKRGVADAVGRLYTERNWLRWDSARNAVRFADVIELVHPTPRDAAQSALFRYILDHRHGRAEGVPPVLRVIAADRALQDVPVERRRDLLARNPHLLGEAKWSWERLSGWLPGGMDAQAWEAVIPEMGYMALLRNLRNFDAAGISREATQVVAAKLASADEVAKSRQFPFRFYTAWRELSSMHWGVVLETALEFSLRNVPALPGRTLVLVDVSGSMTQAVSSRSSVAMYEIAAVFGAALAARANADLWTYAYAARPIDAPVGSSVLRVVDHIRHQVGGGTNTWQALAQAYRGQDRVVILTDEQAHPGPRPDVSVPVYTFNLAGYRYGHAPSGVQGENWYHFGGGLTDASFRLLAALETAAVGGWPWETGDTGTAPEAE